MGRVTVTAMSWVFVIEANEGTGLKTDGKMNGSHWMPRQKSWGWDIMCPKFDISSTMKDHNFFSLSLRDYQR